MKIKILLLSLIILTGMQVFSQAGKGVYKFLDLPASSRIAALSGTNVSLRDNDINLAFNNPSLLTTETSGMISLNYANYLSDIQFGTAMYGHNIDDKNYLALGVQYVDLGKFDGRNELDQQTGTFYAKDMAVYLAYARPLKNNFTIGATLKPVFSAYESYNSFGLALDAGISYVDSLGLFSAGLVFKNMGRQLNSYRSAEEGMNIEPMPFDIQLGASRKFAHAPFRLSVTLHNLHRWDLSYSSPNNYQTSIEGITTEKKISFLNMAFRHANFGVEFVPSNNFYLALGYNHRRQEEMSMPDFKSFAGFSFGGGIKLYKFHVGFGMSQFQTGIYTYQLSVSTSLNQFKGI